MFHKPSVDLKAAQEEILQRATNMANERMRTEVLNRALWMLMERKTVDIVPHSLETMKQSWKPLRINFSTESGFGMSFENPTDPMTIEIMRDDDLYEQVEEIVTDCIHEIMSQEGAQLFITSLLHDLIVEDKSFYEQSLI